MILNDFLQVPADTPDNYFTRRLRTRVAESCSIFITNCSNTFNKNILHREACDFRKKLTKYNQDYRQYVLGINANAKVPAITFGTYIVSMQHMIEKQFNHSVRPDNKLTYTDDVFALCVIDELALIYAKNKQIYDFQFHAVVCQVLTDYFIIDTVPFKNITMIIDKIQNLDFAAVEKIIAQFDITEKKKETVKIDNAFPGKEQIEKWLAAGYKKSYIKKALAVQMGCSEKTVQRLLASYDLTDQKYTTKRNSEK